MTGFSEGKAGKQKHHSVHHHSSKKPGHLVIFSTLFEMAAFPAKVIPAPKGGTNQTQGCLLSFLALNMKQIMVFTCPVYIDIETETQNEHWKERACISCPPCNKTLLGIFFAECRYSEIWPRKGNISSMCLCKRYAYFCTVLFNTCYKERIPVLRPLREFKGTSEKATFSHESVL